MEPCYNTLLTIFDIAKTDPQPQTYLISPREIILRQMDDWTAIEKHLKALQAESLIIMKQLDAIVVCITDAGITKAKALRNNFINNNFSLSGRNNKLNIKDT